MKIKILKIGKMSSIFDFLISKLDYVEFFMKIWEKSFFSKFLPEKIYKNRERILSSFKKKLHGINWLINLIISLKSGNGLIM